MDRLITKVGVLQRVALDEVKEQAIALWTASFVEDTISFATAYFTDYIRFVSSYFFVNEQKELVLMAFNTNEGYEQGKATLIEGIAVDKRFQGQGVMSDFMDQWIKDLEKEYQFVFIQAYNWKVYQRYDFRPFNSNNLWKYTPFKAPGADSPFIIGEYLNEPFTQMQRSPMHRSSYFESMRVSGGELFSYESASLVLTDQYAVNVTYKNEADLAALLAVIGKEITFLLPTELLLNLPGFEVVEFDRLETKLYKRDLKGRFNYIY